MSKLNWRLHTEKDKAWREVLVRKYNINNFSFAPSPSASPSASPVIKCISKGTELFKSGIKHIPRNGHSISFWLDHWVGAAPLRSVLFGPLIENAESILLSDALSNGAINMDAIGYTLPSDLVREILAIPLSNLPSVVDGFSWQGKANGIFSTTSTYRNLIPISTQLPLDWNWIWTTPTLPKIQMFLWQLAHGRIKTLEFLHHIGIVDDPVCKICKGQIESIEHIFRSCPPTASTLHKLSPHLINHNDSDFNSWLRHHSQNMSPSPIFNIPWAIIFCFAIWVIWNQRNLALYKQHNLDPQRTFCLIVERAAEFWSSNPLPSSKSTKATRFIGWDPPPPGWLKLNTDGSAVGNLNNAGCGGLFRDYQGHWVIGFTRNIGPTTTLAAELYAIRDCLNIAVSHHFHSIIVETDCQVAYLLLNGTVNRFHPYSTLIMDCKALVHMIPQVQVKNVLREANMAADALAKKGVLAPHGLSILCVCLPEVDLLCTADHVGVSYPRL
ncbi:hypothetical protein SLE2022_394950 [Rubroshorea leprosula]